jgi:8-oxo-dGTP diphosphatase
LNNTVPLGIKKAAVLCILESDRGFLLLRRTKEPHVGKMIPVGGRIEPHETPRDAVIREVREETGIQLADPALCGLVTETSPTNYNWIDYVFRASVDPVEEPPCDEGQLIWVPSQRLAEVDTPAVDGFIYAAIAKQTFFVLDAEYDEDLHLVRLLDEIERTHLVVARTKNG